VLNTDGWHTLITKQRLEQFLPAPLTVYSFKGQWRIGLKDGQRWATTKADNAHSVVFTDGLRLIWNTVGWEPLNALTNEAEERLNVAKRELNKAVKKYCAKLVERLPEWSKEIRENNALNVAGDPWCCTMRMTSDPRDHLWQHLKDNYVFPTIIVRAFEDSGRWEGGGHTAADRAVIHIAYGHTATIAREVAKYLRKHLNPFTEKNAVAVDPKSNAALEHYVDIAKDVLEMPRDFGYFGGDENLWKYSAPTFTKTRDSENVDLANFDIVWETLHTEFPDLFDGVDEDGYVSRDFNAWPRIYIFGAGHWAVGHIDQIVVPVVQDRDRPVGPTNLHPAFIRVTELAEQTKLYPALPGAEERAAEMDHQQIVKDIEGWQKFLADKGDPFINAFTAEQLFEHTADPFGDRAYAWYYEGDSSGPGVRDLHLLACWQDSLAQADGQEVLV